jgi:hypothetical protein
MSAIEWQHRVSRPHPGLPASELVSPLGTIHVPAAGPRPQRESYFATVPTEDWDSVTEALVHFWLKLAEVLPRFYKGDATPDPLLSKPSVAQDNQWDRIVCLIDIIYGKITTDFWRGSERPPGWERFWIIIKFPMIDALLRNLSDDQFERDVEVALNRLRTALIESANRSPVAGAVQGLMQWRKCTIWAMEEDEPKTLHQIL